MNTLADSIVHKLDLVIPSEDASTGGVELNEKLLQHWIDELPKNDLVEFSQLYLDALTRFNGNQLSHIQRLESLELYREPLNSLLLTLSREELGKLIPEPKQRLEIISTLASLMSKLATGYKIIIVEAWQQSENLKVSPIILLAINRACEQLSFMALHAYKFYQTVPARVFYELHQLYLFTEHYSVTDVIPQVGSRHYAAASFKDYYAQILLVSISNPYGLNSGEVIRIYNLMEQLAPDAEIQPLPDEAIHSAGCFYINCLSDRIPSPRLLPIIESQSQPPTRILNTKPVLHLVDLLFQQMSGPENVAETVIDVALLKQVVPYLNTSYERKKKRIALTGNTETYVAMGLKVIHHCMAHCKTLPEKSIACLTEPWQIMNKNALGYLISQHQVSGSTRLDIGDFIAIFESQEGKKPTIMLASICWLRTDKHGLTKMGIEFIEGSPLAVQYILEDQEASQPAILLPEISRIMQPATIIAEQGTFSPQRSLTIKTKKKYLQFTVCADKLIDCNVDVDRFTFTVNE